MGKILDLIPLIILFSFMGAFAWIAYQMYLYTNELADRGVKHLESKNIHLSREGGTVGVKAKDEEQVGDDTQSVLVKAWNLASFPGYKSKIWGSEATPNFQRTLSNDKRSSSNRPSSSQAGKSTGSHRPSSSRTASGVNSTR